MKFEVVGRYIIECAVTVEAADETEAEEIAANGFFSPSLDHELDEDVHISSDGFEADEILKLDDEQLRKEKV